ncbi:hypothetical protein JYK22_23365, partial [Nonomuraea sp. RK-328]|nr:hypothetical protein [Nonomuraea sp. RK-328]
MTTVVHLETVVDLDQTVGEIEDTALSVVGPDEPAEGQTREEVTAAHWRHLATVLRQRGVAADPGMLRTLPH